MNKLLISFLLLISFWFPSHSQDTYFIKNKGQIVNQFDQYRSDIYFKISYPEFTVFVLDNGFDIVKSQPTSEDFIQLNRIEFRFPNFQASKIKGLHKTAYVENTVNSHGTYIAPSFREIHLIDENTGIEVKYYGHEQGFKYDIILPETFHSDCFNINIAGGQTKVSDNELKIIHPNFQLNETLLIPPHFTSKI